MSSLRTVMSPVAAPLTQSPQETVAKLRAELKALRGEPQNSHTQHLITNINRQLQKLKPKLEVAKPERPTGPMLVPAPVDKVASRSVETPTSGPRERQAASLTVPTGIFSLGSRLDKAKLPVFTP